MGALQQGDEVKDDRAALIRSWNEQVSNPLLAVRSRFDMWRWYQLGMKRLQQHGLLPIPRTDKALYELQRVGK